MTVDVATLVFEFKSDSAVTAEERMDRLISKGEQLEAVSRRVRKATDFVSEGHRGAAGAAERATQTAMALANAEGAVERATQGAGRASAEVRAQRQLEAAAMRELVQATRAYERDQARAAAAAAKAAREQAAAVQALKASVDPLGAAQDRVNAELDEAVRLYKLGAISADQYENAISVLSTRLGAVDTMHQAAGKGAKLQAHELANLGSQFADIGVSLASGQALWLVAIQQGAQIGGIWGQAAGRGATLAATVKQLTDVVGGFLVRMAPLIAIVAAAGGAFLLWRKYVDDSKEALKLTTEASKNFAEVQGAVRDALGSAVEFADKYRLTNLGLTDALDKVLVSQNAAYGATMASIDANDTAGRSAARRAEMERLLTVSILKRAAAEAESRAKEADAAAKKAAGPARTFGVLAGIGLAGSPDALTVAAEAEALKFRKLGGEAAKKAAADEREYAKALNASADALMKAKLTLPEATKATASQGAAARVAAEGNQEAASATDELERALQQLLQTLETPAERAAREAAESIDLLNRGFNAGKISVDAYREAFERLNPVIVDVKDAQKAANVELRNTPADIGKVETATERLTREVQELAEAFDEVAYSVDGIVNAFRRGDFSRLGQDILRLRDGLKGAFSQGLGTGIGAAAGAAAPYVGGTGGRILGGVAAGAQIGSIIPGVGNLVGAAVGGILAAATSLLGGKKSNAGAGYDLITGQVSGKSRTDETTQAATQTGQAILQMQDVLRAAGISLGATVNGLVIGTRDLTQIYLSTGRTLTSAVGDATAAAQAALRGILEGATYASDAQRSLIEGLLAANKSVDEITAALQTYADAQKISGSIADEILRLTDPKAFDLQGVTRDIQAQRDAYKQLATDGYLTADQLATINGQLTTLEGLRLDEVTKRYADAQTEAAMTLEEKTRTLRGLDIEYQRILGNEAAAVAMERADVIAGLKGDADLIAAYTRNWAALDEAAQKAAKGLTETFEAAINITRKRLVTPTVRDPLSGVDVASMWRGADLAFQAANDNVTSMAERAMDAARAFGELQTSLKGYRDELLYGDKSALSADARYADLEKLFRSTANSAALGDQGAAGQLQSVIDQFLDASRSQFGSGAGYASDFARAIAALDAATGKVNAPTATLRALQGYDVFDPEGPTVAGRQDSPGFRGPYWEPNGSAGPGEPQNYTQRFPSGRPTPASNTMSKEDAEELKALLRRQNQLLEAANNQRGQAAVLTKEGLEGVKGEVRRGNKDRVRLAG